MSKQTENLPPLMTIDQVAEQIQCSTWTVRSWIREGKLNHVRMGRRVIRIRREDFKHFTRQQ